MKFIRSIAVAGLFSLLPTEITYAKSEPVTAVKPKPLEDELKELAELAMKCPDKISLEETSYQQGKPVPYRVDIYKLQAPIIPDGNKSLGLPWPETVTFLFREGTSQKAPNQVVDLDDHFEIIGGGASYFPCIYHGNTSPRLLGCGDVQDWTNEHRKAQVRATIKYIKENASLNCNDGEDTVPLV